LRELIRHPDSQGSPFWNIFELSPVSVACFDGQDLEAVLQRTPEIQLRIPAKVNADSEDAERGFRASRTRLGAERRSVAVS
jgi:hypothetical protein